MRSRSLRDPLLAISTIGPWPGTAWGCWRFRANGTPRKTRIGPPRHCCLLANKDNARSKVLAGSRATSFLGACFQRWPSRSTRETGWLNASTSLLVAWRRQRRWEGVARETPWRSPLYLYASESEDAGPGTRWPRAQGKGRGPNAIDDHCRRAGLGVRMLRVGANRGRGGVCSETRGRVASAGPNAADGRSDIARRGAG